MGKMETSGSWVEEFTSLSSPSPEWFHCQVERTAALPVVPKGSIKMKMELGTGETERRMGVL